jgi:hypothetical protein
MPSGLQVSDFQFQISNSLSSPGIPHRIPHPTFLFGFRATRISNLPPPARQRHGLRRQSAAATAPSPAPNAHNHSGNLRAHESDAEATAFHTPARWPSG